MRSPFFPRTGTLFGAGVSLALVVEFFITQIIAQLGASDYSAFAHDISYLGLTVCGAAALEVTEGVFGGCTPLHLVANGGLVVSGVLQVLGIVLSLRAWPGNWTTRGGLVVLLVASVCTAGVGLFPVDGNVGMHVASATGFFVLFNVAVLLLGLGMWGRSRGYAGYCLLTGIVSLTAVVLYGADIYWIVGRGGMERIAAYTSTTWFIVSGVVMILAARGERATI